jgi:WD40 repeat protein
LSRSRPTCYPILIDTATDTVRRFELGHIRPINDVAFSADGRTLLTSGWDGYVRLWDVESRRAAQPGFEVTHQSDPTNITSGSWVTALSPDGRTLAATTIGAVEDGQIHLWDLETGRPGPDMLADAYIPRSVRFSSDGRFVVTTGDQSGDVGIHDIATGRLVGQWLQAHSGLALDAVFDPTGRYLASAGEDGVARLWDLESRRPIGTPLRVRQGDITEAWTAIAFAPDGSALVEVDDRGRGVVWPLDPEAWRERACAVANRDLGPTEIAAFLPGRTAQATCQP